MTALMYITPDGSYGDASELFLVDAEGFTEEDYISIENAPSNQRMEEAAEIATYRMNEAILWTFMTEAEAVQMLDTLAAAIDFATKAGRPGLASDLGDVRDVLERAGIPVV